MAIVDDTEINFDYETFLSDDCLRDYLRTIKRTKPASKEENHEMFLEYQNGNMDIKNTIIEKNLLLVVSLVNKKGRNLSSDKKLEYIQSGVIGLIEAIDKFDLNAGTSFSTYAEYRIQMRINKYRYNNQRLVRRPQYLEVLLNQYRKLVNECEGSGKPLPDRAEICRTLDITDDTLKNIEEDYKLDATSLDAPINEEDDDNELVSIVGSEDTGYNSLLDNIVLEEMLKTFKVVLSPYEYYILYYRTMNPEPKTLNDLANYFGLSKEAIRLKEESIKSKIRKMFAHDRTLKRKIIEEAKKKYPFKGMKMEPCPLENYSMFFFLKDRFKEKDQIILKEILLGYAEFDSKRVAKEINESIEYIENKKIEIEQLIEDSLNDIHYILFHISLIKKYKNKLYRLDLAADLSDYLDIRKIVSKYWSDKTFEEVLELISLYHIDCKEDLVPLIRRFFGVAPKERIDYCKEWIERDVNYSLYGFAHHDIPSSELYPAFLKNIAKFTDKQKKHLNMFIFKKEKVDPKLIKPFSYVRDSILNKLLLLYYEIEDYRNDNFDTDKYISIRSKCIEQLDKRSIELLDIYYGIDGEKHTIPKMSEILGEDNDKTESDFRRAKSNAIAIYLGTTPCSYEQDREIYIKVLEDDSLKLKSPHLDVARMFFIEQKSYERIAAEYECKPKLTQRRVGELINYACSVMDYHRFGITSTKKNYSKEFLLNVLKRFKYSDEDKEVIRLFMENKSTIITSQVLNKDLERVRYLVRKFNSLADEMAIEEVEITADDVSAAVMEHESTNVLDKRERVILSLIYGLKNKYNPLGKRKYPIDVAEIVGIKTGIGTNIKKAKIHVAAHKIGLLKTAIDFIEREELEDILRDQRLPLSEEDKNIIINAYGLYDTEYLTIAEIAKKLGIKDQIARNRLYRGIVTIKKYLSKEIEGNILFDIDIKPYLKYFILEDREILTMLYRDKKTQLEIGAKYGLSTHQFNTLMQKIRMHLSDLRSGLSLGIDFDYFWSNVDEPDVPFYGNKELAIEVCFLYYEKRLPQSEIIKNYHPELGETALYELIKAFTVAMLNYQHGIRKVNCFTPEEVADYYERHQNEMELKDANVYRNYFNGIRRQNVLKRRFPPKCITYDLIRERYPYYFQIANTDADQVRRILGYCGQTMSKKTIQVLESLFGVTHPNLLSDEEWERVINFMGNLIIANELNNEVINDKDCEEESKCNVKRKLHVLY